MRSTGHTLTHGDEIDLFTPGYYGGRHKIITPEKDYFDIERVYVQVPGKEASVEEIREYLKGLDIIAPENETIKKLLTRIPVKQAGHPMGYAMKTTNIAGLQHRINKKLGLLDERQHIAEQETEGFHMMEHILLRPRKEDIGQETAFLTLYRPITALEKAGEGTKCLTLQGHSLREGDGIMIINTTGYNGQYAIKNVTATSFDIEVPFTKMKPRGGGSAPDN